MLNLLAPELYVGSVGFLTYVLLQLYWLLNITFHTLIILIQTV